MAQRRRAELEQLGRRRSREARSVGAQDRWNGGGEGMVSEMGCGGVTEGTNGATKGWEGAGD